MLNTKVAEYMRGETQPVLPRGNYLCVSTVENKLNYTELIIDNLCAKAIAGEKFAICVYDTLGNIINDAKVKRGATQLKFDKTMQFYSTGKAKNEDMVEIEHRGVYHYWEVEHYPYYYGYNNQRKKTFWDNIGSAFEKHKLYFSTLETPSKGEIRGICSVQ